MTKLVKERARAARRMWIGAGILSGLIGCIDASEEPIESGEPYDVERSDAPIIDGTNVIADNIGMVKLSSGCSGIMLSDDWLLTARHCVNEINTPANLSVMLGTTNTQATASRIELHPSLDVAVVRLASPLRRP